MRFWKFVILFFLMLQQPVFSQEMQYNQIRKLIDSTKDNADSLFFLHKQLLNEILRLEKDKLELVNCYHELFENGLRIGKLVEASNYASEAAIVCEKYGLKEKLAKSYYQKARILNIQGKVGEGLSYFKKALAAVSGPDSKKEEGIILGQIGFSFANLGDLDSALYYQNSSLKINIDLKDTVGIASCYSNIGYVYALKNRVDLTRDYYYKASALRRNTKDVYLKVASLIDCASVEQELGDAKKCIDVMHQALSIIKNEKYFNLQANCFQSIAYSYENLKKWDSAYKYHKLFKAISDSLYNQENIKASLKVETKYQLSSKQNEILLLTEKNKNNELLVLREKMIKWIFVCGIVLLVVILFMVFRQLKIKKDAYTEINSQKNIIEEKNKEIIDSIHYAKRIQGALMPTEKSIESSIRRMKKD